MEENILPSMQQIEKSERPLPAVHHLIGKAEFTVGKVGALHGPTKRGTPENSPVEDSRALVA